MLQALLPRNIAVPGASSRTHQACQPVIPPAEFPSSLTSTGCHSLFFKQSLISSRNDSAHSTILASLIYTLTRPLEVDFTSGNPQASTPLMDLLSAVNCHGYDDNLGQHYLVPRQSSFGAQIQFCSLATHARNRIVGGPT